MARQVNPGDPDSGFPSQRKFKQNGSISDLDLTIFSNSNETKTVEFNPRPQSPNTRLLLQSGPIVSNTTITFPTSTGTLVTSTSQSNSFAIVQPVTGTSPTATVPGDTLTFTSSNSSVGIAGNSSTDTIDFTVNTAYVNTIGTLDAVSKSANGAVISTNTLTLQSADASNPGLITSGTQTIGGAKTFNAAIVGSLTGHASLDLPLSGGTMSGNINMGGGKVTNSADPSSGTDLATKSYVDNAVNGLTWKAAAVLGTTAALPTNVYNNGSSGVGATLTGVGVGALTIDGSTPAVGNRILVKNEVAGANNGIYTVTAVGSGIAVYILTRATDFDNNPANEVAQGDTVFIDSGTLLTTTSWSLTTAGAITIGTTALTFAQVSGPGSIIAGTGISVSGNTVSLTTPVTVSNGGTGLSSGTSGGILGYTASGTLASSGALTANQLIVGGGAGVTPATLAAGSQYQVLRMGATTPAYGSINLDQSGAVTGTLPIGNGGTGNTSQAYSTLADGATVTWTLAGLINNATVTIAGARTLAFSGSSAGMSGTLVVKQDATGGRSLALPSGSKVIGGGTGVITLSAAANAIDILTFTYDGTNYFWTYGENFT